MELHKIIKMPGKEKVWADFVNEPNYEKGYNEGKKIGGNNMIDTIGNIDIQTVEVDKVVSSLSMSLTKYLDCNIDGLLKTHLDNYHLILRVK